MWVAWQSTDENPCQLSVKAKHQYAWFEGKVELDNIAVHA